MGEKRTTLREPVVNQRRPAAATAVRRSAAVVPQSPSQVLHRRFGNQGTRALINRSVEAREREPAVREQRDAAIVTKARPVVRSDSTAVSVMRKPTPPVTTLTVQRLPQRAAAAPSIAPMRAPARPQLSISSPGDAHEREADNVADIVMRMAEPRAPEIPRPSTTSSASVVQRKCTSCEEEHADKLKVQRKETTAAAPQVTPEVLTNISALKGGGTPLPAATRAFFEPRFGADFSEVRVNTGGEAENKAKSLGAKAFTVGQSITFGRGQFAPETPKGKSLLAHELAHVVQQKMGIGAPASSAGLPLTAAAPGRAQAAPLVTNVVTSAAELGVGGTDITATATVAGATPLTWTINPGGAAPAGITIIGTGRRVRIHAAQPGAGVVTGGTAIIIRAERRGVPGDFFDSPPVMPVQVVSATYLAAPALVAVPSLGPGVPPANSAEPNRDGIAGNTATVVPVTAPAGRPITVAFRRSLGATLAGLVITPGRNTGDIALRITDTATRARLNETLPALAGPAALMADLTVNAVPTRVSALARTGPLGPYGQLNPITFSSSDNLHPPLTRIVGELITGVRDDFNIAPPNGAFNPAFLLALAVPANNWNDQLITPAGVLNVADGLVAIDINRFAGPGVPGLPRHLIYRQRFQYSSWQGAGTVISNTIADGQHIRSLVGTPAAPRFRTQHRFGGVAAPSPTEAYVGPPLIVLTNVRAVPTAAGATGLAADGAATANLAVTSSVAGRTVNWTVLSGDITIAGGSPAALPATATLQAGARAGTFRVRAADSIFPNRRADGNVRVVPVRLRNLRAAPSRVPVGTLASNVSVNADPGGRTLNWTLDAAATAAGVTVAPATTGPGLAMNVTVTRPAGFSGRVTVTASDAVLPARTGRVNIQFL